MTTEGTLLPEVRRHFIRIHPVDIDDADPDEDPNRGSFQFETEHLAKHLSLRQRRLWMLVSSNWFDTAFASLAIS